MIFVALMFVNILTFLSTLKTFIQCQNFQTLTKFGQVNYITAILEYRQKCSMYRFPWIFEIFALFHSVDV